MMNRACKFCCAAAAMHLRVRDLVVGRATALMRAGRRCRCQVGTLMRAGRRRRCQAGTLTRAGRRRRCQAGTLTRAGRRRRCQAGTLTRAGRRCRCQAGTLPDVSECSPKTTPPLLNARVTSNNPCFIPACHAHCRERRPAAPTPPGPPPTARWPATSFT